MTGWDAATCCGAGRVTELLLERGKTGPGTSSRVLQQDLLELDVEPVDAIFSAGAEEATARPRAAGFGDVRPWLQPWPVIPLEPRAYLRSVIRRPYREHIGDAVPTGPGDPPVLDDVRTNIVARRPA